MLVSGGKVLAIDKVKHDGLTLTGDGCFVPLGVVGFLKTSDADKRYQPKGDYVDRTVLGRYYTKDESDTKFATLEGVYSKDETDTKFDALANIYEEKGTGEAVKLWVSGEYVDKYVLSSTYYSKAQADIDHQQIYNAISQGDTTLEGAVGSLDAKITEIYQAGFVSVSGLASFEVDKQYAIYWKGGEDKAWEWAEVTGGGGGGGGDSVTAENGLTADYRSGKRWIGMMPDYLAAVMAVTSTSATWDTVTSKQDALSNAQLSAISSVSSIQAEIEEALPITGGAFINVTQGTDGVKIAYTGNSVAFIDENQKATATATNTVYMVLSEVG